MILLKATTVFFALTVNFIDVGQSKFPTTKNYEKLPSVEIKDHGQFIERKYPSVKFACTEEEYNVEDEGQMEIPENMDEKRLKKWVKTYMKNKYKPSNRMFKRLFGYIKGSNSQKQKISMTVPVLSKIFPVTGASVKKEMCFYLPEQFQDNPPEPTNKEIWVKEHPEIVVYVKRFGGWAFGDNVWIEKGSAFTEELSEKDFNFSEEYFMTASYDSPWKTKNRTNEIMFEKLV